MNMNDRKLTILKIIIDDFIDTAQPVGSRTIAKKYPVGISSATIRNEMADLEELGYLKQPHTSSGRVPSDLGYRLYVDTIMSSRQLQKEQSELVRGLLLTNQIEVKDVVIQAATLLAELTGMTAIITMPQFKKSKLSNFKLVKLVGAKVLMILVTGEGNFKSVPINFIDVDQDLLDNISMILTERFRNRHIEEIDIRAIHRLIIDYPEFSSVVEYLVPIIKDVFREFDQLEHVVEGINHMMDIPEFAEGPKVKRLMTLLQNEEVIRQISGNVEHNGITIKIGKEIGLEELADCSVVRSAYLVNGYVAGKVAVLGPTRMDYSKVVSVTDYIRETLSEMFSGINL